MVPSFKEEHSIMSHRSRSPLGPTNVSWRRFLTSALAAAGAAGVGPAALRGRAEAQETPSPGASPASSLRCGALAACARPRAGGSLVPRRPPSWPWNPVDDPPDDAGPDLSPVRWVGERDMLPGRCGTAAASMAPPPRLPSCAGACPSLFTSANTRLTDPREIGPTVTGQPCTEQIAHPAGGIEWLLDTASRLHTHRR